MLTRREWVGLGLAILVGNLCFAVWAWGEPKTPKPPAEHGEVLKLRPDRSLPSRVFVAVPERIVDGDTVVFPQGSCRLLGIDAPEKAQPFGMQATQALAALLPPKESVLVLAWIGQDRYGRMLCLIVGADGYLVNLAMVESGAALVYLAEGSTIHRGLLEAQARAVNERRGVWALPQIELPWVYRERMRRR